MDLPAGSHLPGSIERQVALDLGLGAGAATHRLSGHGQDLRPRLDCRVRIGLPIPLDQMDQAMRGDRHHEEHLRHQLKKEGFSSQRAQYLRA